MVLFFSRETNALSRKKLSRKQTHIIINYALTRNIQIVVHQNRLMQTLVLVLYLCIYFLTFMSLPHVAYRASLL